jgi:hypothetical protein
LAFFPVVVFSPHKEKPKMKLYLATWLCFVIAASAFAAGGNKPAGAAKPAKPSAGAVDAKANKETVACIENFKRADPEMAGWFDVAAGYAVFYSVTKGAAGIGAARGDGEVFEKGKLIGTATLTQITLGLQLGGQEFAEIIFFETKEALDEFINGKAAMSAQTSAVIAAEGASADAKYQQGVVVFTMAKGGLMFEASLGGQKFKFTPLQKPVPAK